MPQKIFPTWDEIEVLAEKLARDLVEDYDVVLVITRAGVFPASFLSERLELRNITATSVVFYTDVGDTLAEPRFLNFPEAEALRGKRVLIIDEVWDSGRTMTAVRRRVREAGGQATVAVLHYKPTHSLVDDEPDYWAAETDKWVVYPWDPDRQELLPSHLG
ncbi:MAG: Xanthine phosphoribosyltransferase [Anaerolineales bacterium]|nr:Xanthine phosphoribosyltransferase [Anaerolineales bacterium]